MLWIAITGGIACGKSAFASLLQNKGCKTIDTDQLARHQTASGSPLLKKLALYFGPSILNEKGELDRSYMFDKLFTDVHFKKKLEDFMHPVIYKEVQNWKKKLLKEGRQNFAFCEVPLLYEKGLEKDFDFVLVVSSSLPLRYKRLEARLRKYWPNISQKELEYKIKNIFSKEMPLEDKKKKADHVIENEGTLSILEEKAVFLLKELKEGISPYL